ncbi:MAG: 30S ribosomal protein S4e [Desulfurococcales archaeon]|nr:30S ribosomal protein S4e [Desulfurococcales archaeon]
MARMGGQRRLKRLAAPVFWPIHKKEHVWAVKPRPGPHSQDRSIPLLVLVRDIFGYATTAREARKLISEGHFKVDGVVRKDYKFPVGPMDVIEVVDTGETFRMLPYPTKHLVLHPIPKEEASIKPLRIENKTTVKGGHIQLNLFDGRNILVRVSDPRNPVEDVYKTLDTVIVRIPDNKIEGHIKFGEGKIAIIFAGRNVGRVGVIKGVQRAWGWKRSIVTLETPDGSTVQTSLAYVLVIGEDKPVISLPEGVWK